MTKTKMLQRSASELWTAADLCRVFNVTPMTITNWRARPPFGRPPLPAIEYPGTGRPVLRFVPDDVLRYATRYGIETRPYRAELAA